MRFRELPFRLLGYWYRLLYLLPVVGEWMVRGITKMVGYMIFYSPYGPKRSSSIHELRKEFDRLMKITDFEQEVVYQDDEKFEFILPRCPYGFCRTGHLGVCDAAMDTDRIMFGLAGGLLMIEECIPGGASHCRCSMRMK